MTSKTIFTLFFFMLIFTGILFAGCIHDNQISPNKTSEQDVNAIAVEIALNNETVKSYLAQGYTIIKVGPTTVGINEISLEVTGVQFDTPQDLVGVNVDVKNNSVVNIWALPKRGPEPSNN